MSTIKTFYFARNIALTAYDTSNNGISLILLYYKTFHTKNIWIDANIGRSSYQFRTLGSVL